MHSGGVLCAGRRGDMQAWRLEMALLFEGDYWDRTTLRVQTRATKHRTLEKMGQDIIHRMPEHDGIIGCYLYNYWRVWEERVDND